MFARALLAAALGALTALGIPGSAASPGVLRVPATRSGCGTAHLSTATTLDLTRSLETARRGWRVIYVVQAHGKEPIDALGMRVYGVGTRPGAGEIGVMGYQRDAKFPPGDYRVCVFSDRPVAVEIPAPALRAPLVVRVRPIRSIGRYPGVTDASSPLVNEQSRVMPLTTTSRSVVVTAGAIRYADGPVVARSYEFTTCFVPRGTRCDVGDPLFGTGNTETGSGGHSGRSEGWYYAGIDMEAGSFTAGAEFRGTERPSEFVSFVFQVDL